MLNNFIDLEVTIIQRCAQMLEAVTDPDEMKRILDYLNNRFYPKDEKEKSPDNP